jgi:hypothetical protein
MIQQEHHKTEYHLCEVMVGIKFLHVEYISAILFFFHLTYYRVYKKSNRTSARYYT